jgi:hypothetical protein
VSKLPTGRDAHWHITEFDEFGDPLEPPIALSKYKTITGLLVRNFIPIKYKKWIGKDDDPWRVLESEKDYIWNIKILEYFTSPMEYDKELVKKKAKETMGTYFKTFKGKLYKDFILENKEPDFDGGQYTKQEFWQDFK